MSPKDLLDLITTHGTRDHCPLEVVREHYGDGHTLEMYDDLRHPKELFKIEVREEVIYIISK